MAEAPPAGLSPVIPLLFLALAILTASWSSAVRAVLFPQPAVAVAAPAAQTSSGKKGKQPAVPVPEAVVARPAAEPALSATKKVMVLALCWTVALLLIVTGAFGFGDDSTLFDPYQILNITQSTPKSEIKRVFRTLSFSLHPDRLVGQSDEDKAKAGERFILVSKAYKTLTDDEAMKNYLEFGHPDGARSNSISFGIPAWMLEKENEMLVIFLYLVVFALVAFGIASKVVPLLQDVSSGDTVVEASAPVKKTN